MGYDLNGEKLILSVNVVKFYGSNQDRIGTEADEEKIIQTFKVSGRNTWLRCRIFETIRRSIFYIVFIWLKSFESQSDWGRIITVTDNVNEFFKNRGFDVGLRRSGDVKKGDVVKDFKQFEKNTPKKHDIKILTIVLMAHGLEDDWWVNFRMENFYIYDYIQDTVFWW